LIITADMPIQQTIKPFFPAVRSEFSIMKKTDVTINEEYL